MKKLTEATRKVTVSKVAVSKAPQVIFLDETKHNPSCPQSWMLVVTLENGLAKKDRRHFIFPNEDAARTAAATYSVGEPVSFSPSDRTLTWEGVFYLAWQVVREAGLALYDEKSGKFGYGGPVSQEVIDFLGPERVNELHADLKQGFGIAAIFEYCSKRFPESSPVRIASECLYCFHISDDDFSSGYLLRDLEFALAGIEEIAGAHLERSRKAGAKGRESSSRRKMQRVIDLLGRMESIVRANPIATHMEPEELARHALRDVDKSIWSQGRGQVADYLGEMRRGELGEDLKNRYRALFPDKPPKRFP